MNLFESIRFGIRGLSANKMRSTLTTLGILIGVASVIILIAVGNGSSKAIQKNIERLGTNTITIRPGFGGGGGGGGGFAVAQRRRGNNVKPLVVGDAVALADKKSAPNIKQTAPVASAQSIVCSNETSTTTPAQFDGTWPAYFEASNTVVNKGTYFSNDDVAEGRRVAVIGNTVAGDLFGEENPVGREMRCNGIPFTVIGVTEIKGSNGFQDGDSLVVAPITAVQRSLTGYQGLSSIIVQAKSALVQQDAQIEIEAIMDARHGIKDLNSRDYRMLNQASLLQTTSSNSAIFTVLLGVVAAISLLVGGIGITNIMLVTVVERTREIGIRKAIGARRGAILAQFLSEATILSLLGGALGVLTGFIGSTFTIVGVKPVIVPESVLLAFGVSVLIGLFFGGYPAHRAASLRPIEALRHE